MNSLIHRLHRGCSRVECNHLRLIYKIWATALIIGAVVAITLTLLNKIASVNRFMNRSFIDNIKVYHLLNTIGLLYTLGFIVYAITAICMKRQEFRDYIPREERNRELERNNRDSEERIRQGAEHIRLLEAQSARLLETQAQAAARAPIILPSIENGIYSTQNLLLLFDALDSPDHCDPRMPIHLKASDKLPYDAQLIIEGSEDYQWLMRSLLHGRRPRTNPFLKVGATIRSMFLFGCLHRKYSWCHPLLDYSSLTQINFDTEERRHALLQEAVQLTGPEGSTILLRLLAHCVKVSELADLPHMTIPELADIFLFDVFSDKAFRSANNTESTDEINRGHMNAMIALITAFQENRDQFAQAD